MISRNCRVLIAGGGTAGHVIPAVAIAQTLYKKEVLKNIDEVHFAGSKRGVGREIVEQAGFSLTTLPGRGIERKLSLRNLISVLSLFQALIRACHLIFKGKPDVIVVMGGYASLACGIAGKIFSVPLLVAEQNAVPGSTNKLVSRLAEASAVSFDDVNLPRAVVTGNPLRSEIIEFIENGSREASRAKFNVGDRTMITVFGGSLGARRINEVIFDLAEHWEGRSLSIFHILGSRDWPHFSKQENKISSDVDYRMFEYVTEMAELLGASDLVISRSGATSVSEITALGIPSILIPLPNSPGDHQTANARFFEKNNSAVLLSDFEFDYPSLAKEITGLLEEGGRLKEMEKNARTAARLKASEEIVDLISGIMKRGSDAR